MTTQMTPKEASEKLQTIIKECGNLNEDAHQQADALMAEILRSLGYNELVDSYENMEGKYYS